MESGYIEHPAHGEDSSFPTLQPEDLKNEILLRVDVFSPSTGERQLIATEDFAVISSTGKASANVYQFVNLGLRLENSANMVYEWFSGKGMVTVASGIVHTTLESDWVPATWKNWELALFSDRYKTVLQKMTEIKKLSYNWDSYGADPIPHETYLRAVEVLVELAKIYRRKGNKIPVPFVAPCPDGSIQLEWENQGREVEIVIPYSSSQSISVLRVLTEEQEYKEEEINSPSEIDQYLSWLSEV